MCLVSELSVPSTVERWPLPRTLRVSLCAHAALVLLVVLRPAAWPWALLLLVLNHAWVVFQGLWPRSTGLGPNVTRLPPDAVARREVAITIDDGPDPEVTPAVLDQLDTAGAVATFFCIGQMAERHPALVREIVARGHSVQNHSHHHDHRFSFSGPAAFARELRAGQAALTAAAGVAPTCFRAPAGLRNPYLTPVLERLGLHLVSWTRRGFDTRESDPQRVLNRLTQGLAAGDILLLHDRHCARTSDGRPVVLEVLPALLRRCADAGLKTVTLPQALAPLTPCCP